MIEKFNSWLNESIAGIEGWEFGEAIYKSIEKSQTPGTRKISFKSKDSQNILTYSIDVKTTASPEVFEILSGQAGYSHNYQIVILGHGIYQKYETGYDRDKNPRRYRDWVNDLPEKLRGFLNVFKPECPRVVEKIVVNQVSRMKEFISSWDTLDDDDQAMFHEHPELSLLYLNSELPLEEWKKKSKGFIVGLDYGV